MLDPRHSGEFLREHESLIPGNADIAGFFIPELKLHITLRAGQLMYSSGFCIESFLDTLVPLIGSFLRVQTE